MSIFSNKQLMNAVKPVVGVLLVIWSVFLLDTYVFETSFNEYGLRPKTLKGLKGILTMPFLHGGINHIVNNSLAWSVLGFYLFYFYRQIAWPVLLLIFIVSDTWLWFWARPNTLHVGLSGVIYGLAAFLFISGWLNKNIRLAALSMIIVFSYGGMIWGILPVKEGVSWEGHFLGGITGLAVGLYFRGKGPQRRKYLWEIEEEIEQKLRDEGVIDVTQDISVNYHYLEKIRKSQDDQSTSDNQQI